MATLEISTAELRGMVARVNRAGAGNRHGLLDALGGLLEAQTKRRIADEKRAPDGTPWKGWSDGYKKTRKAHHSLLISTGNLRDDLASEVSGKTQVDVFSIREYAGAMDATRPFLGISSENQTELEQAAIDYMAALL